MLFKRLFIISVLIAAIAHNVWSQQREDIQAPEPGDFQISLILGSSGFSLYDETTGFDYLMPYAGGIQNGTSVGFGDRPVRYLDLGNMNSNSIVNAIGIRAKVFLHKRWDVNVLFGMNMNLQPKQDYIEGDYSIPDMPIPEYEYVLGRTHHAFYGQIGTDFYFLPKNARILPYVGVVGGFQFARVETFLPYTGETTVDGEPVELYAPSYQAGQAWAVQGGFVAGVDFTLLPGLILGLEVCPAMYQMSVMQVNPSGAQLYRTVNHDIKILTMPRLTLGFRF